MIDDSRERIRFLRSLLQARDHPPSFARALWESRMAWLQWVLVITITAACFAMLWGPAYARDVLSLGCGLLLGLGLRLQQARKAWPWLAGVIDWTQVEHAARVEEAQRR